MKQPFVSALCLLCALTLSARAGQDLSSVQVYAARETVRAGEWLPVAVRVTVAEGWHTYAKDPGDFGMPPSITFSGLEGLSVAEWRFPPPETFSDSSGTSYGYAHQVVLLSEVLIPQTALIDQPIELTVLIKWMICRDICVFKTDTQTISVQCGAVSSKPSAAWQSLLKEGGWESVVEIQ